MGPRGTIGAIKGFRDVLPEESASWRTLVDQAAAVFGRYGFGEIQVPIIERTELFARSIGEATDIVEKEMYAFADRDREATSIALRPEATAGVARASIEHGLVDGGNAVRLWYAGPMFRRERPQKGRYRQFHQIGAEVLGRDDAVADAEVITMLIEYLDAVGAGSTSLELNSLGDAVCRPAYREQLRAFADARIDALCADCHRRVARNPLRLLDCKVPGCRDVMREAPRMIDALCTPCHEHFAVVRSLLDGAEIAHRVNPGLVRGLDYYCRTAFEVVAGDLGAQNAVAGGGRYDGLLAALGGAPVAGVGFAIGLERLVLTCGGVARPAGPVAVVLPLEPAAATEAFMVATRLRRQGFAVGLEGVGRSVKALLRSADRQGARLAILIGGDERAARRATVRDLAHHRDHRLVLPIDVDGAAMRAVLEPLMTGEESTESHG